MIRTKEKHSFFDLSGGHPALDLVNSLDKRFDASGPAELLADYTDLLRFTEQTSLLDTRQARRLGNSVAPEAATRALRGARELRESMAATFYGALDGQPPSPGDIRTLERYFHAANAHQALLWKPPPENAVGRAELAWDWGRSETSAELPVWLVAQSAAQLMLSDAMARVRACGVDTCRWLFLDTSKNHTRRWCNMKVCGNRMKARRFQARREG
jgi:predicted RNA-binding Zn ribbon-like protein